MKRRVAHRWVMSRAALTYIDIIVIIVALLLLVSIFFPFNDRAYRVRRRLECANNLRQLALASVSRATSKNGNMTLLSEPAPGLASQIQVGWPVHLLPYLDRLDVIEYLSLQKTNNDYQVALQAVLSNGFRVFQCPLDAKRFKQPGGFSYGANIGYGAWRGTVNGVVSHYDFGATDHNVASIDWNANGELDSTDGEMTLGTGVVWFADKSVKGLTIDDISIGDGTGTTILFAESMNLTPMHQAGPKGNGENPRALDLGIGIGYESLGLVRKAKPSLFVDQRGKASEEYRKYFSPNSNQGMASGRWPAVSSLHGGGANVVFADGHAGFISDEIHWAVWASLHTPRGMAYSELKVAESDF